MPIKGHPRNKARLSSSSETLQRSSLLLPLLAQLHYQQGEKRLMLAVLMDAVGCIERYYEGRRTQSWPAFHAARRWVLDRDRTWLFSFENICLALDLDPDRIRSCLFAPLLPSQRSP
jgi:hypothetical protein